MAKSVNGELKKYIEQNVFPEYSKNEAAHNLEHVKYVIERSFKFAQTVPDINADIVFVVAAYHDIGHHIDPKKHEIIFAEIMQKDEGLKCFFSPEELTIIKEAIEDHRASSDHEPRSIYGKIVSTADRNNTVESCLFRSYSYGKKLSPSATDEQLFERAYNHLKQKFGVGGYAKFFFEDEEYEKFLEDIRKLLADKKTFIEAQRNYINKLRRKDMKELAKKAEISYERKPGTLHSFFALKFHDGDEDREKVEAIEKALNKAGIEITLMARDVEKWGEAEIPEGKTLMKDYAFPAMRQCDCNIIEFSEKGVGLGMNGGFCYAAEKPIYVIAKKGSDISTTMANIATEIIFYDKPEDLVKPFTKIVKNFPRVILASKSPYRKQLLIDASIPFEVAVSDADETPDETKSFKDQLAEIAMRKAQVVLAQTKSRGRRLIIAADQNIVFNGKMYGKPKSKEAARKLIEQMRGSDEVYSYTGNAVLLAEKDKVLQSVNITDIARMSVDDISDKELDDWLNNSEYLSYCGGISIMFANFVHLKEGRLSTAKGMTLEYAKELLLDIA